MPSSSWLDSLCDAFYFSSWLDSYRKWYMCVHIIYRYTFHVAMTATTYVTNFTVNLWLMCNKNIICQTKEKKTKRLKPVFYILIKNSWGKKRMISDTGICCSSSLVVRRVVFIIFVPVLLHVLGQLQIFSTTSHLLTQTAKIVQCTPSLMQGRCHRLCSLS